MGDNNLEITTGQLEEAMRQNPFDATFKAARIRLEDSSGPSSPGDLNTPQVFVSQADTGAEQAASSRTTLSIKLPESRTQSPGLFSNAVAGLDTPEIARMVQGIKDESNRNPPGTAEVLNAVLDIQSNPFSMRPRTPPPQDDTTLPSIETGPTNHGPTTLESRNGMMLSVRVGDQTMQIPVSLKLNAEQGNKSLQLPPQLQPLAAKWNLDNAERGESRSSSLGPDRPPSMAPSEELQGFQEKRNESLERNKAAAIRYRKRKKEEQGNLKQKVKKLEEEKIELMTQVAVLKRELENSRQEHQSCACQGKTLPYFFPNGMVLPAVTQSNSAGATPLVVLPILHQTQGLSPSKK